MSRTNKEITTLSSIKSRAERGLIDKVQLVFYREEIGNVDNMFVNVDPDKIPNSPQRVVASVDYNQTCNYAQIKARSLFGLSRRESYYD